MAVFREPTNIAMDRKGSRRTLDEFYQTALFGNPRLFQQLFPEGKFSEDAERNAAMNAYYKNQVGEECLDNGNANIQPSSYRKNLEGAYRFTNKHYRMPQIAAYARTPMRYFFNDRLYSNEEGVHVLNLVGAGFDAWQQPDYQYYFDKNTQDIRSDRDHEFYRERQVAFAIALQCAYDHQLDRIEFVPVGAGAFSSLLPNNKALDYLTQAWKSEEVQSYKKTLEKLMGNKMVLSFRVGPPYNHNNGLGGGLPSFYEESGWMNEKRNLSKTLFINAWDPWSLVGNGNEKDYSVDGFYGRQSALALLCWPITNPHIQYKKIEFSTESTREKVEF
eukprot:CAMPEP_0183764700 /NCGR_PEP_ID=MMETSP0739-20130205/10458_1 /TAXON_ID=385413 /ORGANISM="Thalassiosira miniscula, Strain CCMP1093" /LENGTH=331 /DNA_ID=CAMNT_0026003265 /DNA_START=345 /DNA_END=1340 /DNA_ORIENTATION=-